MNRLERYYSDPALLLFGFVGAACLVVSAPATYRLVALFHDGGGWYGLAATIALVLILEAGTIASKLATLAVTTGRRALNLFCALGLLVNAVSNFITGLHVASQQLDGWLLYIGAIVYAALVPVLAYVMLSQFVKRVETLRGVRVSVQERVTEVLLPMREAFEMHASMITMMRELNALQGSQNAVGTFIDSQNGHLTNGTKAVSSGLTHIKGFRCSSCGDMFESLRDLNEHRRFSCQPTGK